MQSPCSAVLDSLFFRTMPRTIQAAPRLVASIEGGNLQDVTLLDELSALRFEGTCHLRLSPWISPPNRISSASVIFLLPLDDLSDLCLDRQESFVRIPVQNPGLIAEILAVPHLLKCAIPTHSLAFGGSSHCDMEVEPTVTLMDGKNEWSPMCIVVRQT
ncbi:hypothetical protein [Geothrix fuzhouensis]|uniref:hypothetical protein n=1 Tax=Geothrix fuzhouensis TaxID=2966451 RepID=UPI002148FC9E|nr:hypothetical protein [Geothrix fuzhouensis]